MLAILSIVNPLLIFSDSFVTAVQYFGGTIRTADILFSVFSVLFEGFILGAIIAGIAGKTKKK